MTAPLCVTNRGALRNITRETLEPLWLHSSLTIAQIAERLNVTASALHQKAARLGLPPRGKRIRKKGSDDEFRRMWLAGVSREDMARHFGYKTPECLSARRKRLGLAERRRLKGAGKDNGLGRYGWAGTITLAQYREQAYADALAGARP